MFKIGEQSMNHFSKYWGSQKVTFNFHFMIRWVQNEDENRNLIDPPEMEPIHHFHCEMVFMLLFGFNCAYKCWYHHSISRKTENSDSSFDLLSFSLNRGGEGETGSGAHTRIRFHKAEIRANQDTNSMAAHLINEHPEYLRDPLAIKFSIARTGPKCLERHFCTQNEIYSLDSGKFSRLTRHQLLLRLRKALRILFNYQLVSK